MPATLTYPGVYIEEISSGVHTITGVATSITAFIGRASRGPTDEDEESPVIINSFGDFERIFGGLWKESSLGFSVRDFFFNGGAQAVIVRLFREKAGAATDARFAKITNTAGQPLAGFAFRAAYPGKWGSSLRVSIDVEGVSDEAAESLGILTADGKKGDKTKLFSISVRDVDSGNIEQFPNLSVADNSRRIDRVLKQSSRLLRLDTPPTALSATISTAHTNRVAYETALKVTPFDAAAQTAADTALTTYHTSLGDLKDNLSKLEDALTNVLSGGTSTMEQINQAKRDLDAAIKAKAAGISDGDFLQESDFFPNGGEAKRTGIFSLEKADLFNLLCIPPYKAPTDELDVDATLIGKAAFYCERRRAFFIVDPPRNWKSKSDAVQKNDALGTSSKNSAVFFPRLRVPNPFQENRIDDFAPSGAIAGVFARTDTERGVWKAPAGLEASLVAVPELSVKLTDAENGELNPKGVNCLRAFPAAGRVVWGSRTRVGDDRLASEWKYIPVRRTALFIEESLYRGTQWVVFEPNDEPLWAQIRLNLGAFMQNLFRQGAFQGRTPREAYLVKCDSETTTQNDINLGIVNIIVGFAPLKPAEFVIIKLQQLAGQIEV